MDRMKLNTLNEVCILSATSTSHMMIVYV